MKCLILVVLTIAVAAQAMPFYEDPYMMGGYGGGHSYGDSDYGGGRNGYNNQGYGQNYLHEGHNIGQHQDDYDASVHHHAADFHNIGGLTQGNSGGHMDNGYNGFNHGHNAYGNGYQNGYM